MLQPDDALPLRLIDASTITLHVGFESSSIRKEFITGPFVYDRMCCFDGTKDWKISDLGSRIARLGVHPKTLVLSIRSLDFPAQR